MSRRKLGAKSAKRYVSVEDVKSNTKSIPFLYDHPLAATRFRRSWARLGRQACVARTPTRGAYFMDDSRSMYLWSRSGTKMKLSRAKFEQIYADGHRWTS